MEALLAKDDSILTLRIELETARARCERRERAVTELTEALGEKAAGGHPHQTQHRSRPSQGKRGGGGGKGDPLALEDEPPIVAALTRVVDDLRRENADLKRGHGEGGAKYRRLLDAHKRAKEQIADHEITITALKNAPNPQAAREIAELKRVMATLERDMRRTRKDNKDLSADKARQARVIEGLEAERERLLEASGVRTRHGADANANANANANNANANTNANTNANGNDTDDDDRRRRAINATNASHELFAQVKALEADNAQLAACLERRDADLIRITNDLARTTRERDDAARNMGYYERELELLQSASPSHPGNAGATGREVARLTTLVSHLETHIKTLQRERDEMLGADPADPGPNAALSTSALENQDSDPYGSALSQADRRLLISKGRLYSRVVRERDALCAEVGEMKAIISRFDAAFFAELDRIRDDHRRAVQVAREYDSMIGRLATRHGFRYERLDVPPMPRGDTAIE
jgi:chromosome segregation ATPase